MKQVYIKYGRDGIDVGVTKHWQGEQRYLIITDLTRASAAPARPLCLSSSRGPPRLRMPGVSFFLSLSSQESPATSPCIVPLRSARFIVLAMPIVLSISPETIRLLFDQSINKAILALHFSYL